MAQQQMIEAIGRLERAISRLERADVPQQAAGAADLERRYSALKSATEQAVAEIDRLLVKEGSAHG